MLRCYGVFSRTSTTTTCRCGKLVLDISSACLPACLLSGSPLREKCTKEKDSVCEDRTSNLIFLVVHSESLRITAQVPRPEFQPGETCRKSLRAGIPAASGTVHAPLQGMRTGQRWCGGAGLELKPTQLSACLPVCLSSIFSRMGLVSSSSSRGWVNWYLPPPTTPCGPIYIPY